MFLLQIWIQMLVLKKNDDKNPTFQIWPCLELWGRLIPCVLFQTFFKLPLIDL